ncbi:COP23 domain-containing protein [Ancylothrix sp. C2]|uniref:COP23 domain-containing protein n=1 Tax=Ancylothrix sp. D3o TaxID=2953691 RepID=UPI0021BA7262|nr:COP23 domain-containing protein [Ancylothrix sp. D3o]MCT7949871.1 COP23 domain-containing protein [Ancylothrix sp. D3o]
MKNKLTTTVLTAMAMTVGATVAFQQPSQAQATRFICSMSYTTGLPTTYAIRPNGERVAVVRWYSEYFSDAGYTPERRCQEVTGRFQNLHNQGQLTHITTGYVNGQAVVCASQGSGCNSSNLLFTLKPGQDAAYSVQQLFDLRATAGASGPLYESSADDGSITIDLNNYINNAAVEQEGGGAAPSAAPSAAPGAAPSAPAQPSQGGGGIF